MEHLDFKKGLETVREAERAIQKKMFGYIAAGLGLVAGLAWNDAVKSVIDYFIPQTESSLVAKLIYAVIITTIVGLIVYYLERPRGQNQE